MKRISYIFLTAMLFVGISGCGDSTGPDIGEPPQPPNLEQGQPDVSYFQDNNPQKATSRAINSTENFSHAKQMVLVNSALFSFGQSYGMFFSQTDQEEATYDDGVWEWTYSYNFQGMSANYRTTAEEIANAIKWATYWSYDDGQGDSVEDYNIFEGTVSNDGSTGDWTFNAMDEALEEEVPFITSSWNNVSETEKEITLEMFGDAMDDETAEKTATIYFEQDGAEFTMELNLVGEGNYLITWNTDTNVGSMTTGGETICWDEEFQDIPCS